MKRTKMNIMMCAALIGTLFTSASITSASAAASSPPASLPLSLNALQAYAWEQTEFVESQAWSSGSINGAGDTNYIYLAYSKTNGMVNERDVMKAIANTRLSISVLYSNDNVGFSAGVFDEYGYELFWGSAGGPLAPSSGPVSTNIFPVKMRMNDQIWFTLTNVSYAYIVERDDNGNVIRYYYPYMYSLGNGVVRLLYPAYFGDKAGELILTLPDGTQVAYSLKTNKKIIPTEAYVSASSVMAPGNYYFENTNIVMVPVSQDEYDQQMAPLVQYVNSTTVSNLTFFSSSLPTGETQTIIRIWQQGTDPANAIEVPASKGPWSAALVGPGYWWVEFRYPSNFGIDSNQYYPPYDNGGGGGKGVAAESTSP